MLREDAMAFSNETANAWNNQKCGVVSCVADVNIEKQVKLLALGKPYHVYFIYSKVQREVEWVRVVVKKLELRGFVCVYRDRDFIAGRPYAKNVLHFLENSIKIVVLLSEAFVRSSRCIYELDQALEECFSRKDDGDINTLIPILLETCKIPKQIRVLHILDVSVANEEWWERFIQSLDADSSLECNKNEERCEIMEDLEETALSLKTKLTCSTLHDVVNFLSKPIALELSNFFSNCSDLRFFYTAMGKCGIVIQNDTVNIEMKTLKQYTDHEYHVSDCFKGCIKRLEQHPFKISISLSTKQDILQREKAVETIEFNEIIRCILRTPEKGTWSIMWKMDGLQKDRYLRDECRSLVHEAVLEKQISSVCYANFNTFDSRIETFSNNWPSTKLPSKEKLAEAGYFCEGSSLVLRCFHCDVVSWDFKPDEDPWARHAKWMPYCPYVLQSKGQEFVNNCRFRQKSRKSEVYNTVYSEMEHRLSTFKTWDQENAPKSILMAQAGFYFTSFEDKVICFQCGNGFRDWSKNDDPWYRHIWYSPHCRYVLESKGECYIKKVQRHRSDVEQNDKCILTYWVQNRNVK